MPPQVASKRMQCAVFVFCLFGRCYFGLKITHPPKMGGNFVIHFLVFYTLFCTKPGQRGFCATLVLGFFTLNFVV